VRGAAFAYVLKPVSPPDLLDTTRRALDQAALYRERERLRRELESSELRHRELVESVPAFVLAMDEAGRLTTWNSELERVTGYARAEMLGTDGRRLVGDDGRPADLPLKAGGKRKVRWRRAEVQGRHERVTSYAIGIDVTDEDEILRRVLRSERLAAVGTLAAGLAHEVRNPLNSASLQLTLLERRLERGDEPGSVLPIAHIIKSEIDRLDRLVREFLAFAQPRPLEPRPVDVAELFSAVTTLIAPEAEAVHVSIAAEVPPGMPAALGETERLRQVVLNLTRNAIEAMHDKGGQLRLTARRAGRDVELTVEDDGPGFGEDLPVFDAFFTTKTHGTGLGLSIVHRIVTDHGGTIRVESRPGRTCFTLALPAAAAT
jgi:signal transduction histidine kinase